jgi:2,4-dienoyl-CoA reductase (NADPH2)
MTDIPLARETREAQRLQNPQALFSVKVEEISSTGVKITDKDGNEKILPFDTLIISRQRTANDALFEALHGKVKEVYKIGDCDRVRAIKNAIWAANELARRI